MADQLNSTPGRKIAGKNSGRVAKFDHDAIDALENQERLKVWQLGRYANWGLLVYPTAAQIILFAQLASHLEMERRRMRTRQVDRGGRKARLRLRDRQRRPTRGGAAEQHRPVKERDKRFEKLARDCAYRNADEAQKLEDARLIFALHQILDRYAPEAKALYQDHSRKKFGPDASET